MSHKQLFRIISLTLLFLLAACSGSEVSLSSANISDARLTKDEDGTRSTSTFSPTDTFYLLVDLANAPDDTTVKVEWTAVSAEGADSNTVLDDVELTGGSGTLTFDLQNDNPWPAGDYKVDLYLNDELEQTLTFKVSSGLSGAQPEDSPAETPEETTGSASINRVEEVKTAVIQIEAQGTFVDPEIGTIYNAGGRGSGFIIDPSGIAVTNNHVVTGAALLKVWVGGESEPRNARVLGASECGDLAVIDIEGKDFLTLTGTAAVSMLVSMSTPPDSLLVIRNTRSHGVLFLKQVPMVNQAGHQSMPSLSMMQRSIPATLVGLW